LTLQARDIFTKLSEWPHRGTGSDNELEAREALSAELTGEYGVHVSEEGFFCPRTYLPFLWLIAIGQAGVVAASAFMPFVVFFAGLLLFASHLLFFDWRVSPLIWWGARGVTANLTATKNSSTKGDDTRLVILMAHLDSAPSSFAYRPAQVRHFKTSVYMGTAIVGFGVLVPAVEAQGFMLPDWLRYLVIALLVAQGAIASMDYWRFGYTPGADDNLSGVAAATQAASALWRKMPPETEVRLVVTSGEEAGMLGAQHYWRHHQEELHERDSHVLNFDTLGNKNLGYVVESGGFTRVHYDTPLARAADALTKIDKRYAGFEPRVHHVGDFDSVWFVRDGISSLTIAAYDDEGLMPHIHTPEDKVDHVDLDCVEAAAAFGEALVRTLPRN